MIVKIVWTLIGINALALLIFFVAFLISTDGRNVDGMEKGWMTILFIAGVIIILLSVLPLHFGHSDVTRYTALFFAALPLVTTLVVFLNNKLPSFKKEQTMAELYYTDKSQRAIASAIEQNDTVLLADLIKDQNVNIQGNKVWGWDGLNYLQFAIRLRSNHQQPFNEQANTTAIKLLVQHRSETTRALAEGIKCLPPETISVLLDAGADPNTYGFVNADPLLYEAIGIDKKMNDIAMLLVQRGADVNARNRNEATPLMFAANNAGTSLYWVDVWRLIRFFLEEAHADCKYTDSFGNNFSKIISTIEQKAEAEQIQMPADFGIVVTWLKEKQQDINSDLK